MSRPRIATVSPSKINDEWQRQTTAAALVGAKTMIGETIPPGTPIGRLGDRELGFIITSVIFAFVETRARQAMSEGEDIERAMRATDLDPDPWDAGPIIAILPDLAKTCSDFDWSLPIGKWPKETMAKFLIEAMKLIKPAIDARDLSERGITQKTRELDDNIPF
jgi:hypothetical protein